MNLFQQNIKIILAHSVLLSIILINVNKTMPRKTPSNKVPTGKRTISLKCETDFFDRLKNHVEKIDTDSSKFIRTAVREKIERSAS